MTNRVFEYFETSDKIMESCAFYTIAKKRWGRFLRLIEDMLQPCDKYRCNYKLSKEKRRHFLSQYVDLFHQRNKSFQEQQCDVN